MLLARPPTNWYAFEYIMVEMARSASVCAIIDELSTRAGGPKLMHVLARL